MMARSYRYTRIAVSLIIFVVLYGVFRHMANDPQRPVPLYSLVFPESTARPESTAVKKPPPVTELLDKAHKLPGADSPKPASHAHKLPTAHISDPPQEIHISPAEDAANLIAEAHKLATENPEKLLADAYQTSGLLEDVHLLPDADLFLPHFKAVTALPGVSMADAKAGCNWNGDVHVNFQYDDNFDWVKEDRSDLELEERRLQWQKFLDNDLLPYSEYEDRFDGRGIVIVAGVHGSLQRVRVLLRALKKLGSQMEVEIHYWDKEMTGDFRTQLESLWPGIHFNDLSAPTNILKTHNEGLFGINYQLKTAAVINSRFAEPLLMDSDNIPVVDPATLYETDIYEEYGTLFWPDIARTRPNNPMWGITNTPCRMDEYEQESGQLIVDKRRFFYHMQLAAWFNNDRTGYYNVFLLGDKDMFRFAWHALKTDYGKPDKWLTSVGTLNDGYYCGHSFAQYHPDGEVAFLHGGLLKTVSNEVLAWERETKGGIFQAYKKTEFDEQPGYSVTVGLKWDSAEYIPNKSAHLKPSWCTDFLDDDAKPMHELIPGFDKTFAEIGGFWMLDENFSEEH